MKCYLGSRDWLFPLHPQLWLWANGSSPTRSWFLQHLHQYLPAEIAGQSIRAGGATALAEAGAPTDLIRGTGRWSSNAFKRYIRKNVIVLHALILGCALHYSQTWKFSICHLFHLYCGFLRTVLVQISLFPLSFILILYYLKTHTPKPKKKKKPFYLLYHSSRYCTNNIKVSRAAALPADRLRANSVLQVLGRMPWAWRVISPSF